MLRSPLLWMLLLAIALTASLTGWADPPDEAEIGSVAVETADLKDQLEKDLKARRPEEFAFIAKVVLFVETDKLPLSLVNSTFLWARKQRPRPYQYFERGLRVRARKLGIDL